MNFDLRGELLEYCVREYYLFPVRKNTKKPAISNNLNEASIDIEQLMRWSKIFPDCNWAISLAKSGLVAVDVDHSYGGMEAWKSLIDKHGDPNTLSARSGSGGLHYIFRADKTKQYRRQIQKGIDVKYNGYIIVFPSIHKNTGDFYEWKNFEEMGASPAEAPSWIKERIERVKEVQTCDEAYEFSIEYLKEIVLRLKNVETDYEEWVQLGMALHSATNGSDEGLELYQNFTLGVSFKNGDLELAKDKWTSFSICKNGITGKTLFYLMHKKGIKAPNPFLEEDKKIFKKLNEEFFKYQDKQICFNRDAVVEKFNNMGLAYFEGNPSAPFALIKDENGPQMSYQLMKSSGLAGLYPYMKFAVRDEKKGLGFISVDRIWKESENRRTIKEIVFKRESCKGELNLFNGFHIEESEVYPEPILDILFQSLCNGCIEKFNFILDYFSHLVQKPFEKSPLIPVFIGRQGTGKSFFMEDVVKEIFGRYFITLNGVDDLSSRFNKHLEGKLITFIDESEYSPDRKNDAFLKKVTGSSYLSIEPKGLGRYDVPNPSRYVIATNNRKAVSIEAGNRRLVPIESSSRLASNDDFFKPRISLILRDKKYIGGFYNLLLKRDISSYNPHKVLQVLDFGEDLKIERAGEVVRFWIDYFSSPTSGVWLNKRELCTTWAYEQFLLYTGFDSKDFSSKKFWKEVEDHVLSLPKNSRREIKGEKFSVKIIAPQAFIKSICESIQVRIITFDEEQVTREPPTTL